MLKPLALAAAMFFAVQPALAEAPDPARKLVEASVAAHGGEAWLSPRTLVLAGEAVFYSPDSALPQSRADDYRMWREMDPTRTSAHGADGKVRITARDGDKILFEVGYDGENTWTEKGIMPKEAADAYWASNFGFGIIRAALAKELQLQEAPARSVDGRQLDMVRVIDSKGQATLFGFDRESHFIRYMGFRTPRGWHERTYDDFVRLPENGWVQARLVTLYYDGVMANQVKWKSFEIGRPLDEGLFRYRP